MKVEFENSITRLSFLCGLPDIKIAWIYPWIWISQWSKSHCTTNTNVRRKKEIRQRKTVRITVWDLSRKVNHLSKVIWDTKIITKFNRSISSTRIDKPVLMMDIKVSKDKSNRRWVDRSKVKPVKNISKNLQSFLEISPMQKEVSPPFT